MEFLFLQLLKAGAEKVYVMGANDEDEEFVPKMCQINNLDAQRICLGNASYEHQPLPDEPRYNVLFVEMLDSDGRLRQRLLDDLLLVK